MIRLARITAASTEGSDPAIVTSPHVVSRHSTGGTHKTLYTTYDTLYPKKSPLKVWQRTTSPPQRLMSSQKKVHPEKYSALKANSQQDRAGGAAAGPDYNCCCPITCPGQGKPGPAQSLPALSWPCWRAAAPTCICAQQGTVSVCCSIPAQCEPRMMHLCWSPHCHANICYFALLPTAQPAGPAPGGFQATS